MDRRLHHRWRHRHQRFGELVFEDLTITQDGANTRLGVSESGETLAILNNVLTSALNASSFVILPDVSNPQEALAL